MARVLVVDDEKLIVKGIRFSLEQDGMEVDCAYDGEEAIELAKKLRASTSRMRPHIRPSSTMKYSRKMYFFAVSSWRSSSSNFASPPGK